jgi:hypothetical protein
MKLTPQEERIARLALDKAAEPGERTLAADKLVQSLFKRGVTVEDLQKETVTEKIVEKVVYRDRPAETEQWGYAGLDRPEGADPYWSGWSRPVEGSDWPGWKIYFAGVRDGAKKERQRVQAEAERQGGSLVAGILLVVLCALPIGIWMGTRGLPSPAPPAAAAAVAVSAHPVLSGAEWDPAERKALPQEARDAYNRARTTDPNPPIPRASLLQK